MHAFIETLISLVGLYILFSIVNSAIVEVFVQMLNERGKFLKKSLSNFFDQAKGTPDRIVDKLYQSKLFRAYARKEKLPDYIDKTVFSKAMMELLFQKDGDSTEIDASLKKINKTIYEALNDDLKRTLHLMLEKAKDHGKEKIDYMQKEIEDIYETYMKTVTYWYHKRSKVIMGIMGFLLALIFNLDSIHIYNTLMTDSELRREQVAFSHQIYDNYDQISLDTLKLEAILAPQGWKGMNRDSVFNDFLSTIKIDGKSVEKDIEISKMNVGFLSLFDSGGIQILLGILGCLMTGLALSFGSTFWFSILKRLIGK
jgi:hypothetical protein